MASVCLEDDIEDARGRLAQFIRNLEPTTELTPTKCPIEEVPGAYILHEVLSIEECDTLQSLVKNITKFVENKDVLLTSTEKPRRNSQHHTPCHVQPIHLFNLSARLRLLLPQIAGPSPSACDTECELEEIGAEISTFLRCYHYRVGDFSTPHYDRSQYEYQDTITKKEEMKGENEASTKKKRAPCKLVRFSAFSILLYLNDDFTGGETTFLSPVSYFISCFF